MFNFSTPSPLTDLVAKKVCFLLNPISNPLYCKYLLSILSILLRNSETSITIVLNKGTNFKFERKGIMPRAGGMKSKELNRFIELITDEWPEQLTIINLDGSHFDNTFNLKLSKIESVSSLKNYPEFGGRLGRSIHSALATSYAKSADLFIDLDNHRRIISRLERDFRRSYSLAVSVLNKNSFEYGIILNGRFPGEAGFRKALEDCDIEFLSLEHGSPRPDFFHLENYQTQERDRFQAKIKLFSKELSEGQIKKAFEIWSINQRNNEKQNPFLRQRLKPAREEAFKRFSPDSTVVIFTSSVDENISSPGFLEDGWPTQEIALCAVIKHFTEAGFKFLVRIHPNSLNKSWEDLNRIVNLCEEMEIPYYHPLDDISSYDLLDYFSYFITWHSTIGLEASALGKYVYIISENNYDEIADVKRLNPRNLLSTSLNPWSVDPMGAMLAACCQNYHGYPVLSEKKSGALWSKFEKAELTSQRRWKREHIILKWWHFRYFFFDWKKLTPGETYGAIKKIIGKKFAFEVIKYMSGRSRGML